MLPMYTRTLQLPSLLNDVHDALASAPSRWRFALNGQWRPEYGRALRELRQQKILTQCHAIYLGDTPQQDGPISVWPLYAFLEELSAGRIFAPSRVTRASR